jgi:general secretion pathway protein D
MMGTDQGVPYLSDIPVVGNLFSFETQRKMKVNLIILLTPRVVTGAEDLERMSYEQRRLFGEARRGKGYFPGTRGLRPKPKPATAGGVLLPAIQPIDAER